MFDFIKKLFGGGNKKELIQEALQRGALIIDVRTPGEFGSGHIKGAKNIPLQQIGKEAALLKKAGKPVIVCCASGMRSAQAKSILSTKGIDVINGGGWMKLQHLMQA
jgi:rhodanese-related sulfurtransferase